jgi:hypothetical protein
VQVGQEQVSVPFAELGGDPTAFDPDWRAKVASAIAQGTDEKSLPRQLRDKQISVHARFLREFLGGGELSGVFEKYPLNGLVMNWTSAVGSSTKYYLQALLLTEVPIKTVAEDLQLDEKVVKLYCDLYFACRSDKEGYEMVLPMETRLAFAFGEMSHDSRQLPAYTLWRVIAVRDGYAALVRHWGTEKFAHGPLDETCDTADRNMWLANSIIEQQLRTGAVSFRSLIELQNSWLSYRKMKDDANKEDGAGSPLFELLGGIFAAVAPKLVDQGIASAKAVEAQVEGKKRLAEAAIGLHNPDDAKDEELNAEFNKLKREKFKLIDENVTGAKT